MRNKKQTIQVTEFAVTGNEGNDNQLIANLSGPTSVKYKTI